MPGDGSGSVVAFHIIRPIHRESELSQRAKRHHCGPLRETAPESPVAVLENNVAVVELRWAQSVLRLFLRPFEYCISRLDYRDFAAGAEWIYPESRPLFHHQGVYGDHFRNIGALEFRA